MQSCANEPCMATTVLGIILHTVNMVSLCTCLLWGFTGSSQTCKHPLWWFTALHHFYLSLSQSFTPRLFAHAATLQFLPLEHQRVTKSLTSISHLEPKRWFSRLFCLQCTVLLKNRKRWIHSITSICSEIKQRFINICAYLQIPWCSKEATQRDRCFQPCIIHRFNSTTLQKKRKKGVCVYFIYLVNPQIDSCKMLVVKV